MSQDCMDPEIFADFITEAKEHMERIEPNLLELEQQPDNIDLLNKIFRPMHSLKGASGFLGLSKINKLAHRIEDAMDGLRKGKIQVNSDIMDTVFSSIDALKNMIENLEAECSEGDTDIEPFCIALDEIMVSGHSAVDTTPQIPASQAPSLPEFEEGTEALGAKEHLEVFLEEAWEMVQNINEDLMKLEKAADKNPGTLNDIFRYFHNLKGNGGIVNFSQLVELTHEAETLLNMARREEIILDSKGVDLLFAVSDAIESLLGGVNVADGIVKKIDIRELLKTLQTTNTSQAVPAGEPAPNLDATTPTAAEKEDDKKTFHNIFSRENAIISQALKDLAQNPAQPEAIDSLHRSLMALADAASQMNYRQLQKTTQRTAILVAQARDAKMDFSLMTDILQQECAIIAEQAEQPEQSMLSQPVEDVQLHKAEQTPPQKQSSQPLAPGEKSLSQKTVAAPSDSGKNRQKTSSTIRVEYEKLDQLMNLIGELIINRNRYSMLAKKLEKGEKSTDISGIVVSLTETTYALARISDELQDTIMKVRMMPIRSVFSRFPRLVRDLSHKSGKKIDFIVEGEETELDKSIIEKIGDPLVHLIRNSVDHGLETSRERKEKNKPEVGKIWLRAYYKGNSVAIEVQDDGRGINLEKMRELGVKKGIVTGEESKNLDDQQVISLIFEPGFSGAEKITDISGRGVGMDVVKTNIKNLKGIINVATKEDEGTRFTLILPLTLAIIDALMVTAGGEVFAIPLEFVSEATKIEASHLTEINGKKAVTLRDEVLGVVDLATILGIEQDTESVENKEILPIIVVQNHNRRLGLIVENLLERQEIVIKPLGTYLGAREGISGATIMGDGSVILILDPHEIYHAAI